MRVVEYKELGEVKSDSELENKIKEIDGSLNHILHKSIRYCLLHLANENSIEINGYELNEMINKSYSVRNEYVHRSEIKNGFDECLDFLTRFSKITSMKIDKLIKE